MEHKKNQAVIDLLMNTFELSKACPKCRGPLERGATYCGRCEVATKLKVAFDTIETTIMQLRFDLCGENRVQSKVEKPKPKPKQIKKQTTKKPAKKRKSAKK